VVSVTNQAEVSCAVSVEWFRGFITSSDCTTEILLDAGIGFWGAKEQEIGVSQRSLSQNSSLLQTPPCPG
jgi:hypothetical protein